MINETDVVWLLRPINKEEIPIMSKTNEERAIEYISRNYNNNITYDCYKNEYYYNDVKLDISDLAYTLMKREGINIRCELLELILQKECAGSFNSLEKYLHQVYLEHGENDSVQILCNDVLKCKKTIEKKYIEKFLISAVARVYDPGCKVDQMLIFFSQAGGLGKTTFFTELAKLENFVSANFNSNNMELRKMCSNYWIVLFDEIDSSLTKRKLSEFKTFITDRKDTWRKYYTTSSQIDNLRRYVLCGTTNKKELLVDDGAERRFWTIEIKHKIDIEWVKQNRDRIWSQAVHLYNSGQQWWLTDEEQKQSNNVNKEYKVSDPFSDEIVETALSFREKFTLRMVANQMDVSKGELTRFYKLAKETIESRTKLTYPKKQTTYNNTRGYWWEPISYDRKEV